MQNLTLTHSRRRFAPSVCMSVRGAARSVTGPRAACAGGYWVTSGPLLCGCDCVCGCLGLVVFPVRNTPLTHLGHVVNVPLKCLLAEMDH